MLGDDSLKNTSFCVSVLWNYDLLFIKHISRRCWDLIFSYMQVTLEFASCIIASQGFLSSLRWIRCRGLPYSSSSIEVGLLGYAWTCPKATCTTFRKPGMVQVHKSFLNLFLISKCTVFWVTQRKNFPPKCHLNPSVHHFIPYSHGKIPIICQSFILFRKLSCFISRHLIHGPRFPHSRWHSSWKTLEWPRLGVRGRYLHESFRE